jgi:hypothetical protein
MRRKGSTTEEGIGLKFSSSQNKFSEEFVELYATRLKLSCLIGLVYIPIVTVHPGQAARARRQQFCSGRSDGAGARSKPAATACVT